MSIFSETVTADTPRLVVGYREVNGAQQFGWQVIGEIPAITLLGQITKVQSELSTTNALECEESLVIARLPQGDDFAWFMNPDVPYIPIIGILEVIKAGLVAAQLAKIAETIKMNSAPVLGPDGILYNRRRF